MSDMDGKVYLFALPALVFAALGYLYLRLGSAKPEEDGGAIPLRTLFSEKQRRISALCTAVFGTALAVCSVLRFHDTAEKVGRGGRIGMVGIGNQQDFFHDL